VTTFYLEAIVMKKGEKELTYFTFP